MMWDFSGGAREAFGYHGRPPPNPSPQPGPQGPYPPPMAFPSTSHGSPYSMPTPEISPPVQRSPYPEPAPRAMSSGQAVHVHVHHSGHHHHSHHSDPSLPLHTRERRVSSTQYPPANPQARAVLTRPTPATLQPIHHQQHSGVVYSRCTGARKAVCIGINYRGQPNVLHGCVNDARNVRRFLIDHKGYRPENVALLVDDVDDPRAHPTRANIVNAMRWLVYHAHPHDALFFHYSGHGGQVPAIYGDEIDGFDEIIYPLDHQNEGYITDNVMHDLMVKPLPPGCRLTALFDCCHSGSILDLPYLYHTDGRVKGSQVDVRHQQEKSSDADVVSWSGCMDSQTSADTYEKGVAVGAMSYAFMVALKRNPEQSYQQLLSSIRRILKDKYSQKPQLSSSHHIDTTLKFIM